MAYLEKEITRGAVFIDHDGARPVVWQTTLLLLAQRRVTGLEAFKLFHRLDDDEESDEASTDAESSTETSNVR